VKTRSPRSCEMSAPGALASRLKDLVGRSGTVGAVGLD
jgi:hypothetical protein